MIKKKLKIMYVCPFYINNIVEWNSNLHDIVLIDWQLRLISFLINQGHTVLTKQHPESQIRMPNFFFDTIGAKDIVGNFEKVYEQADILLIDQPSSTVFGYALTTFKPIIFIDFGFHKLKRNESKLLKKRCYIIRGIFLKNNQVNIDWNDLYTGLKKCFSLDDIQYQETII